MRSPSPVSNRRGLVIGNDLDQECDQRARLHLPRAGGVSYLGRHDLAHVVPSHDDDLGGGIAEGDRTKTAGTC